MNATIVRIGNSRGIRIPKPILEQCGLTGEVELDVINQELVIRPAHHARQNWAPSFQKMAQLKDDSLLEVHQTAANTWDDKEWEWK